MKKILQPILCLLVIAATSSTAFAQTYIYDPPGSPPEDFTNLSRWILEGGSSNPTNFTDAGQTFVIDATLRTLTLNTNWTVGSGSKVVIGDGISSTTFIIPENFAYTGTIDVEANSTLEIANNTVPSMGTLASSSTVIYSENDGSSNQVIAPGTYGNLILRHLDPFKEIASNITVTGNFEMQNDATLAVVQDATLTLEGNLILHGNASFTADVKDHLTIATFGNDDQIFSASSGIISCKNLTSTKTSGSLTFDDTPATSLDIGTNFTISYAAFATFNDNGNTVTVGGTFSLGTDGDRNIPAGMYQNISLDLSTGNNAILQGDVTVNGTLDLNGSGNIANVHVELGSYNLTVNGGFNNSQSSSNYIITNGSGVLIRPVTQFTPIIFPVGTSSYTPCNLFNFGSNPSVNFSLRTFNGVLNNGISGGEVAQIDDMVNRTWVIEPASSTGLNVTLILQWNASDEGSTFDRSIVRVFKYDIDWQQIVEDTPSGSGPYSIPVTNVTSFSEFSIGDAGSTLPVTWLSFTGEEVQPGVASLEWKTASELNNEGFEVQKSMDGKNFEVIGFVEGAGTTNAIQTYGFTDEHLSQNTYYRLKQIDFDGKFDYSRIIFVESSRHIAHPFSMYPNPVNNNTPVHLIYQLAESNKAQPLQLQLHDMRGSLLLTVNGTLEELNQVLNARLLDVSQGVYLLTLTDFATLTHFKVLKQ